MTAPPSRPPLPVGTRLVLDRSVRHLAGGTVLTGGHPGRLVRLTGAGRLALAELLDGSATTEGSRRLGRRLVEVGMAHPLLRAATDTDLGRVTAVVPVRDRSSLLNQVLECLVGIRTVVVDDGSVDPEAIAEVCRRYGATLLRRPVSGGPAAARNDGLARVDTELAALVDSDCRPSPGWLAGLVGAFDDPEVAAVAPRVRPVTAGRTVLARYLDGRSPLDLGTEAGPVGPDRRVRYVPTAALVVRRAALAGGAAFDPDLRFGEDVDLVWRLVENGWVVRYEPSVEVGHAEPTTWSATLARRFRYGTSAGPLARRHPGTLTPVELRPVPTAAALSLLAGHPVPAAVITAVSGARLARRVQPLGVPASTAVGWSLQGTGWTVVGLGRAATVLVAPAVATALLVGGRTRPRQRLRRAAVALLAVPAVVEWWQRRPDLDPLRWTVASVVDDVAYGVGVWAGSLAARTTGPLLPVFRENRSDEPPSGGPGADDPLAEPPGGV